MSDDERPIRRRKSSATWSFLSPDERTISSASQLNAQNQKVRRGLEVVSNLLTSKLQITFHYNRLRLLDALGKKNLKPKFFIGNGRLLKARTLATIMKKIFGVIILRVTNLMFS